MPQIECQNAACVWLFNGCRCSLHKKVRHDSSGVCLSQESVSRGMSDYAGCQSPGVDHGSHGYTQRHGRTLK